jgi:hypothetical protein
LGVIGVLQETGEGDLGIEFIIGPRAILEFWKIGFLIQLRPKDIIYEGGNGPGIEPNFGISAELNKFQCRGGDRAGTVRGRKGQGWLMLK